MPSPPTEAIPTRAAAAEIANRLGASVNEAKAKRDAAGARMAERIEDGLQRLRRSGEFERRYQSWKKLVFKDIQLAGRVVFRLPNQELSPETPLNDKYWWDDLAAELAPRR